MNTPITLWILAYLGGLLTILSPCILPVLPFVFSRADQPFRKSTLPMLIGMAVTFAVFSTLAVLGGDWVVHANEWGRRLAIGVLSVFALTLIFPSLAEKVTHPITQLGSKLSGLEGSHAQGPGRSFLLGVATGLLWAPCAGPILGLILTGAALKGASIGTTALLLSYALGAATSLAAALALGGKFLKTLKKYLGADIWVRRILGTAVLLGVIAIGMGWDTGILTQLSRIKTESLEQRLLTLLHPEPSTSKNLQPEADLTESALAPDAPELTGATAWLNSPPLTKEALLGKVVLIDFWTYSCINCLRSLPYVEAWANKYKDAGLVVIGVHAPEFAFEKSIENVKKSVHDLCLSYPILIDNDYKVWKAFQNSYWPAHYFIDIHGKIRHHHFGEGEYEKSERVIQKLLAEKNGTPPPSLAEKTQGLVQVNASGVQAKSNTSDVLSPETYLGYNRGSGQFASSPPLVRDQAQDYSPKPPKLNQWNLTGRWKVEKQDITLIQAPGKIRYRFHARDLHLVLGTASGTSKGAALGTEGKNKAGHFKVLLDGQEPGQNHGVDLNPEGSGTLQGYRLYQLIRLPAGSPIEDHTFEIEFLTPGVQAFAFTFG